MKPIAVHWKPIPVVNQIGNAVRAIEGFFRYLNNPPGGFCSFPATDCKIGIIYPPGGLGGSFVEGTQILRTIETAEGPLNITATVEAEGDTLVLKNLSVAHPEGTGVVTNPGTAAIKGAVDSIKAEAKAAGYSSIRYTSLSIRGAPAVIDKTISLK